MTMKLTVTLLLCLCAPTLAAPHNARRSTLPVRRHPMAIEIIPDAHVRAAVKEIRPGQIQSMEFDYLLYGPRVMQDPASKAPDEPYRYPDFTPIIDDPRLIARFLQALKQAEMYKGVAVLAMERPVLRIIFKNLGKRTREPLYLAFNNEGFGPKFEAVLDELPHYLAAQMHRQVAAIASRVQEVDFSGARVTDPAQVARIVGELPQVGPEVFAGFHFKSDTFGVTLRLQGGKTEDLVFVISPASEGGPKKPSLPGALWSYYEQFQKRSQEKIGH